MSIHAKKDGAVVSLQPRVKHNGIIKTPLTGWAKKDGELVQIWGADEVKLYVERTIVHAHIPEGTESVGNYAFYGCRGLTSITIPDSVTSIDGYAFYGCSSLTSITIPDSVTSIGHGAFSCCEGLTSIAIPDSVTSIDYYTFECCEGLTSVVFKGTPTTLSASAFRACTQSTLHIYVPWSEGAVVGAPWGAINATIHYNYDTSNM